MQEYGLRSTIDTAIEMIEGERADLFALAILEEVLDISILPLHPGSVNAKDVAAWEVGTGYTPQQRHTSPPTKCENADGLPSTIDLAIEMIVVLCCESKDGVFGFSFYRLDLSRPTDAIASAPTILFLNVCRVLRTMPKVGRLITRDSS